MSNREVAAESAVAGNDGGGREPVPGTRQVAQAGQEQDDVEKRVLGDGDGGPRVI